MPVVPRQLISSLSEALQSRISTASVGVVGTSTPVAVTSTQTVLPAIPVPTPSTVPAVPETSVTSTQLVLTSTTEIVQTPTVSIVTLITTTSTPVISTTQAVTTSSAVASSSSSVPPLVLTTPVTSTPQASVAPTTSRSVTSPSVSATGAASNAGSNAQDSNSMGGGIIALIVVGALLAVLLAGAFMFRRIQVHRRAKRRENNYGAGAISDNSPFPFTNVSEADLKGAQPVGDFRQGGITSQNEKPLPSILPDVYPVNANSTFGQPAFGNSGMTGPYPAMAAAGYGYGPNRTASPAPSQAPRMMSPTPPPAAYVPTGSPAPSYPNPYAQPPPPAPVALAPVASLAVPQVSGKKRVIQTFQPTLPDELDIRDGDWVTILHAYDDGWGLCECNGRRGVVPLECLDPGRPDFRASRRFSSLSAIRQ